MKKLFACLFSLSLFAASAHSALISLPTIGIGQWVSSHGSLIDLDGWGSGEFSHSFELNRPTKITIAADDCCIEGDSFGLILDNKPTAWSHVDYSNSVSGDDLFHGVYTGKLDAGTHIFSLSVLTDCCGDGGMSWGIAQGKKLPELTPLSPPPVPEPSTYAMILVGLGMLGFMIRHKNT